MDRRTAMPLVAATQLTKTFRVVHFDVEASSGVLREQAKEDSLTGPTTHDTVA
jgi:hypothetical protein